MVSNFAYFGRRPSKSKASSISLAAGGEDEENKLLLAERVAFCSLPAYIQQAAGLGFQATHSMDRDARVYLALFVEKYNSWDARAPERKRFMKRIFHGGKNFPGFYARFPDYAALHPR